jgi:isopenicillin-N epimerase
LCDFPFVPYYQPQGTRDPSAFLSVPTAINFQLEHEWELQRERCHRLTSETRERINALTGLDSLCPEDDSFFSQMVSIRLPEESIDAIRAEFTKRNIVGLILNVHNQYLLRVSYQAYNTQQDADILVKAVKSGLQMS